MTSTGTSIDPWPASSGTTVEFDIFIWVMIAVLVTAGVMAVLRCHAIIRPSRLAWALIILVLGAVGVIAGIFGLSTAAPAQQAANEDSDAVQAAWTERTAEWAASRYGVTAGAEGLAGGETGDFLRGWRGPSATVIAQGEIVDVELRYIGDQAVLLIAGIADEEELPRIETAE